MTNRTDLSQPAATVWVAIIGLFGIVAGKLLDAWNKERDRKRQRA